MFIAAMYNYGHDAQAVGVDGIRGCLGIFLITTTQLFAIHIPPGSFEQCNAALNQFVAHVNATEPNYDRDASRLIAVVNGPNRLEAEDELRNYSLALGITKRMLVRLDEHLGPRGFQQDAAAVICELYDGTRTPRIKYQRADDVHWDNAGWASAGCYRLHPFDNGTRSTNPAPIQGWHMLDVYNSRIAAFN